jgi:hypothetical protein
MSNLDWIEELLEDEPISVGQISIIEGLLSGVPYEPHTIKEIEDGMLNLTYNEASELIYKLNQDFISKDPREQFKKMFKYGNHKTRND